MDSVENYRLQASKSLPRFVFDYIDGGAENEECMRANRNDFETIRLVPRVLRDTTRLDTSVEVFGSTWRFPFAMAPTGLNGLIRPGGDSMLAAAAADMGVPFTLSTASNQRLEDVQAMNARGEQWLQLYVLQDRKLAQQLIRRAKHAGYRALVLTVDVPVGGHRLRDVRNGFVIPLRLTPKLAWDALRKPKWAWRMLVGGLPQFVNLQESVAEQPSAEMQAALLARSMDRSLVWDSLQWLRGLWDGPLLIKGVLHPDDGKLALRYGVDGLVVSNHGGRQLDMSPSAISALPQMVDSVADRVPVFLDGGVRNGGDVIRAQSVGARAVFVGRSPLYGLACNGHQGVLDVMRQLAADYERNLILLGQTSSRNLRDAPRQRVVEEAFANIRSLATARR